MVSRKQNRKTRNNRYYLIVCKLKGAWRK